MNNTLDSQGFDTTNGNDITMETEENMPVICEMFGESGRKGVSRILQIIEFVKTSKTHGIF